jgi:lysophospholipase L1-like esterase
MHKENAHMLNRRAFLQSGALAAGAAAWCGTVQAAREAKPDARSIKGRGYGYRLPGFPSGGRLVFVGDSITDMNRGRNESDRNHYLGHSYVYLIAARLGVDMPEVKLEFFNRGVGSNMMTHLRDRWQKDAVETKPDLLSLLFGVNDVYRLLANETTPEAWEADYRSLLEASRAANPELNLVLLDPFVLASGRLANPDEFRKWREKIDLLRPAVARIAADFKAVHVKTQEVFDAAAAAVSPEHWIWDGVHPLPQGHELIARAWLEAAAARWPKR